MAATCEGRSGATSRSALRAWMVVGLWPRFARNFLGAGSRMPCGLAVRTGGLPGQARGRACSQWETRTHRFYLPEV